ncbi:MAG: hypothetical protein ACYCZF_13270 [Anaerolineae bacterium]
MLRRYLRCGLPLLLLCVIGCTRYQEMTQVDTAWLQAHVGQSVKISGCLAFACITAPGAQYPRDCVAAISDRSSASSIALEFAADKVDLRTRIDKFYPNMGQSCRPFGATGVLTEHGCAESDTGCVTSYGLAVTAIEFFNP